MASYPLGNPVQPHYRGTVESLDMSGRWWVTVDNAGLHPATIIESWAYPQVVTGVGTAGTAHTHGPGHSLTTGDRVLVAVVNGNIDDLVIIGRLPS
jgi:hypothetical protein